MGAPGLWTTQLSRVEIATGLDGLTVTLLGLFSLMLVIAIAAWIVSLVRRSRSPEEIDVDAKLCLDKEGFGPLPRAPLDRPSIKKLAILGVCGVGLGLDMMITGHTSGRTSHYGGSYYTADGPAVRFAGTLLTGCTLMLIAAISLRGGRSD